MHTSAVRVQRVVILASLVLSVLVAASPSAVQATDVAALPGPLQGVLSATFGADDPAYRVADEGAQYRAANRGHSFAATMGAQGLAIRAGGEEWRLRLSAWSRGESRQKLATGAVVALATRSNRVEIDRGGVVEWWVNGPLGLEQGWTVHSRPAPDDRGPLTLVLAQSGSLRAGAGADQRALMVADGAGRTVLRYAGLAAYDATGRELPASFEVNGGDVRVRVDDAAATYPVRIDPWVQAAKLTAFDGAPGDRLGSSVAVSSDGSTVVAGADGAGAVYVFVKPPGGWATTSTFTAKLTASGGNLGISAAVSADGSTVVAGAFSEAVGSNLYQGAVYVFVRPPGGWASATETARLAASDGADHDQLGVSVGLSGDGSTVAAGAFTKTIGSTADQGAVYVFVRPPGGWANGIEAAELTASDGVGDDRLGNSVAVSGDGSTVVAGPSRKDIGSNGYQGEAYVFVKPGAGWATGIETARLTASDGAANDMLGGRSVGVSADGSTVVAGADGKNSGRGAAYVFIKPGPGWASTSTFAAELTAADGAADDDLGGSVAISAEGSTVVAGAYLKTVGGNSRQGAVYVFVKPSGGWVTTSAFAAEITASDGAAYDELGTSVAVSGNGSTVVAGAIGVGDFPIPGAAYVFGPPTGSPRAAAPAFSPTGLAVLMALLSAVGWLGLRQRSPASWGPVGPGPGRCSARLSANGTGPPWGSPPRSSPLLPYCFR